MSEIKKLLAIIGCAKSGTSALAHHLATHPDIVLGKNKELRFFTNFADRTWMGPASDGFVECLITDWKDYVANFSGLHEHQWVIDASTDYIWCQETPELLAYFSENCDVRVICIVRDPLDRAISEYNHTLRHGWETLSFGDSIDAEEARYESGWHPLFYHKRRSTICADLSGFSDRFQDRLLVIDYSELRDAKTVTNRIYTFLGISGIAVPQMEKRNESFIPRNDVAKTVLNSGSIKKIGRALLPASARKLIWQRLHTNARNVVTVQKSERERLRDLLSEEIERCAQDPLVPTQNWTCV